MSNELVCDLCKQPIGKGRDCLRFRNKWFPKGVYMHKSCAMTLRDDLSKIFLDALFETKKKEDETNE